MDWEDVRGKVVMEKDVDPAGRWKVLENNLWDLATATRDNLSRESSPLPGLILIYSAIDIVSWLASGDSKVRQRFTDWVGKYLLPHPSLRCSGTELYAARCGLLHEYGPDSDLSRSGAARRISYLRGPNLEASEVESKFRDKDSDVIVIDLRDFFEAFMEAIDKFLEDVRLDPSRTADVLSRSDKFFAMVNRKR